MATRHNSLYRLMLNPTQVAIPLFVFMGVMLERSKVAEALLDTMGRLFGTLRGGLGSILIGAATPTEAASVGAVGAMILAAAHRQFNRAILTEVMKTTVRISSMVFLIFIGALMFSATFRGYGGDHMVEELLSHLPGGVAGAMFIVMLVMFFLGFILDFIEITLVMVPIIAPVLLKMMWIRSGWV